LQEKTKLKEIIKKCESEFIKSNGRPLTKEDREFHKEDFEKYKVCFYFYFQNYQQIDLVFFFFIHYQVIKGQTKTY
jgi:hypothetical protein